MTELFYFAISWSLNVKAYVIFPTPCQSAEQDWGLKIQGNLYGAKAVAEHIYFLHGIKTGAFMFYALRCINAF